MPDVLNFPGDRRNFDSEHIYGPDLFRGCYRAADADYDTETDRTALRLVPIPPDTIQDRGILKAIEAQAERDTRERIETLFGTGAA